MFDNLRYDRTKTSGPPENVAFRKWYPIVATLVTGYLTWLFIYHIHQLSIPLWRIPVIIISFAWLSVTIIAAHFNQPTRGPIPHLSTAVLIPSRNEDPKMLEEMFRSLDNQAFMPALVVFVENGESNGDAEAVFRRWAQNTPIEHTYFISRNRPGKRSAQVVGCGWIAENYPKIEVLCTVDGDTKLDSMAMAEGLKAFNDAEVTSVAGLLVGQNYNINLLTRIVNLGFVSSFMNGRAAWSTFRSVAVNCGGLAFYRMWVVKKHLGEYGTQTLFGNEVNSGDDRMLTAFSALEGDTVFQHTSVGFTLLPVNASHLNRQRVRWWRSFWWGGIWGIRRFNPNQGIWWLLLSQYITFALYAIMFPVVLIYDPIANLKFPWAFLLYVTGLSYLRSARTLKVKRPDQSTVNQIIEYLLLSPLVTIINLWLCTLLQWWGLVTFWKTDWMTRGTGVEVGFASAENTPATSSKRSLINWRRSNKQ